MSMPRSTLIDGRFELRIRMGEGGMGVIYRALDHTTGADVALKLLVPSGAEGLASHAEDPAPASSVGSLGSEAKCLMEMRHPGIVRYVAHGVAEDGSPYLAMEWLEGEDLATRLERGPIAAAEVAYLVARLAEALAALHDRGVVHRDMKPSNVFLVGGDVARPKLLDFGIAEQLGSLVHRASKSAVTGTPAYMSPEQIRGRRLDGRSDLFSLGCVLFECLMGERAFSGASAVAVMARILVDEAPSVLSRKPDAPLSLVSLVRRLLAKDRALRPPDARAVTAELEATALGEESSTRIDVGASSITSAENRQIFVTLVEPPAGAAEASAAERGGPPVDVAPLAVNIARLADEHRARIEVLFDGSILVVVSGAGSAIDVGFRAARCALRLREALPERGVVLATGRAALVSSLPTGEAIESAVTLLAEPRPALPGIRVDAATAGLLGARFHIERDARSSILVREGEREDRVPVRQLMGRPTPFLGREAEIVALEGLFAATVARSEAQAVIVTAAAGVGKSRLRAELLARIERGADVEILGARADPMSHGTPLGLVATLIRSAVGIAGSDIAEEARRKLRERVDSAGGTPDGARIAAFLGECVGLPFGDEGDPKLRAARQNPMLMGDQMRLAFEDLLLGLSSKRPVLLALEDLQWADRPTVSFLDAALRTLHDRPLFVIAFGRPEVDEAFPGLWAERRMTRTMLAELPPDTATELVRLALGAEASPATVTRIVNQASGNPFFLEELVRAVAEGHGEGHLPESVLAMAEARLEVLPEALRQALRAASVFGETFSRGGLALLLGRPPEEVDSPLGELVEREIIIESEASSPGFRSDGAFSFRHSLMRQVAYARLTDHDLALGHRLAADWLSFCDGADARVIAQHLDLGGEPARAVDVYVRAVRDALAATDLAATLALAARARQCGASGARLGEIRLLEATAHHWRATFEEGERAALDALGSLPPFSALWYRAAEEIAETCFPLGKMAALGALGAALYAPPGGRGAISAFVVAASTVAMQLFLAGKHDVGADLLARLDAAEVRLFGASPLVAARSHFARATRAMVQGDLGAVLHHAERSIQAFDEAGDLRSATLMRTNLAYAYTEIGAEGRAEEPLRAAMAAAARLGLPAVISLAKQNLGLALARAGRLEEARLVEEESVALSVANKDRRLEGNARIYLAQIQTQMGDPAAGEEQARRAIAVTADIPPMRTYAQGTLAQALLGQGAVGPALAIARSAMETLASLGTLDDGEAQVRLIYARTLAEAGEADAARAAIEGARALVLVRASKIGDAALRESFLRRVPEHAEILALSEVWETNQGMKRVT